MTAVRGWDQAEATPAGDGVFTVRLDGRELRLPDGSRLLLGDAPLAAAVAAEWNAAGGGQRGGAYGFADLTLTRLAATESITVAADRAGAVDTLLDAAGTDTLCFRAASPPELVRRQHASWQPWLDWIADRTGAAFVPTEGVMPVDQPPEVAACLRPVLEQLSPAALAALLAAVPALGSLVLGLALVEGRLPPAAAARLALLEAEWEAEQWGETDEWRHLGARLAAELETVGRFLALRAGA